MFAFAIWDGRARQLLLARDRYGKKPLYHREDAGGIAFASEIKALLAIAARPPEPDPAALLDFLAFDVVPGPRTAFRGIAALPPGHLLLWRDGACELRRWFRPSLATRAPAPPAAEAERELRHRLRGAIGKRLPAEVPFGVFLSGGVDSGAIVALLAERGERVRTFSVAFRAPDPDESRWARRVARRFGTEHHEIVAGPELAAELPRVVRHFDQPFGDPSALPTWLLAREARREITVALTGEGGDEAFAGYQRYRKNALAQRWLALPAAMRRPVAAALAPVERSRLRFEHPLRRAARFAALAPPSLDALYPRWLLHFDPAERAALVSADLLRAAERTPEALLLDRLGAADGGDLLARELGADTLGYLPEDLLVKTDVATMAHGLEARCPFLDPELIGWAAGLPSDYKLRGGTGKWLLKRALRGRLPRELLVRPKQGFGLPLDRWLRGELRPLLYELLLSRRAIDRGLFRPGAVEALVTEHERGARSRAFELWNLLVLELWLRERVDAAR
jgi:asparagine synthase (glutamine-hydrolysing)